MMYSGRQTFLPGVSQWQITQAPELVPVLGTGPRGVLPGSLLGGAGVPNEPGLVTPTPFTAIGGSVMTSPLPNIVVPTIPQGSIPTPEPFYQALSFGGGGLMMPPPRPFT